MTTQKTDAGNTTWINLVTDLSLVVGIGYTIQNVGSGSVALLSEKSSTPVAGTPFHTLFPGQYQDITPETGLGLWIKGKNANVTVSVTESA